MLKLTLTNWVTFNFSPSQTNILMLNRNSIHIELSHREFLTFIDKCQEEPMQGGCIKITKYLRLRHRQGVTYGLERLAHNGEEVTVEEVVLFTEEDLRIIGKSYKVIIMTMKHWYGMHPIGMYDERPHSTTSTREYILFILYFIQIIVSYNTPKR